MTENKKRWIIYFTLLAMMVSLASCGSGGESAGGDKRTIKIGYLPITHAAPLYIAHEHAELGHGEFSNFHLELVKFGSWPDLMDALNAGQIDGASVLVQLAMQAKEQNIALKAVALGHRDGNVIVTSHDIHDVTDLKQKHFAIPHKFSTHNILLYQMLKQSDIPYEDLHVVELPPAEMPAALAEGRIAGYAVAEPFGAMSVVLEKGKPFFQSAELWKGSICCVLVLREELIEKEREAVEEFVANYVAAGEKAETKDEHIRSILSKYMDIDDDVLDVSLQWIAYDDLELDEASYEELRGYLTEMELSEKPPTYEEFVDRTLLDEVK